MNQPVMENHDFASWFSMFFSEQYVVRKGRYNTPGAVVMFAGSVKGRKQPVLPVVRSVCIAGMSGCRVKHTAAASPCIVKMRHPGTGRRPDVTKDQLLIGQHAHRPEQS